MYPRVRDHFEYDELVGLANAGLAEAASRYEPDRGASFTTFAWYRVHGAMLDGMRRAGNLPRRVWAKITTLRAADDYLEQRAERDVGAEKRGVHRVEGVAALARVRETLSAIRTMYMISLEGMRERGFDIVGEAPQHEAKIDTNRFAAKLRDALATLPEKERELVTKHYWEGKNLLEAGAELGISKSWASRLHAQAVERLRSVIDGPDP